MLKRPKKIFVEIPTSRKEDGKAEIEIKANNIC